MRLALISDIHEDIVNLERILQRIETHGFDRLICLGDVSGFSVPHYTYFESRNASRCLSLLRDKQAMILPGNHDFHASKRIPAESAVFDYPENWYQMDFREKQELADGRVWLHEQDELDPLYSESDRIYLSSLPEYQILETEHHKILFSHYVYPNMAGFGKGFYIHEEDFGLHFDFMNEKNCAISFTGHTHMRGVYTVTPRSFRHHSYRKVTLRDLPVVVGIHPVSRNKRRSGFCIFDTKTAVLQAIKY